MLFALAAAASLAVSQEQPPTSSQADLVLTDGRIYTVDASHSIASALAIRQGRIVFVGSTADARRWIGPATKVEPLGGRLVLPGLVDSHIHPLDIVDLDVCDLDSHPMSLRELSAFVAACLARYRTSPGQWLIVHQWSYTAGNQPDPEHPTLRAAATEANGVWRTRETSSLVNGAELPVGLESKVTTSQFKTAASCASDSAELAAPGTRRT